MAIFYGMHYSLFVEFQCQCECSITNCALHSRGCIVVHFTPTSAFSHVSKKIQDTLQLMNQNADFFDFFTNQID